MRVAGVLVALAVLMFAAVVPAGTALAQEANPTRVLPGAVETGETFNVTVTFSAPADNFKSISLIERAPAGWNVTVDKTWCTPAASSVKATGNEAQLFWSGSFSNGTSFSAVYKVTVPEDADAGFHTFSGALEYYLGFVGPYGENVVGDSQVLFPPEFDVIRHINETLKSPNMLYPGDTFEVFVNWSAPLNNFSAVGLTDLAPAGFEVEANKTWCFPTANATNAASNEVEILWYGSYASGTNFSAVYKVTVPSGAALGSHFFPYDNCSLSWLEYSFGGCGPYTSCTVGDNQVVVTVPGGIGGETRDVNANQLSDVIVTLCKNDSEITSDASTPNYTVTVNATGEYWLRGSKDGYFTLDTKRVANSTIHPGWNPPYPQFINLPTLELLTEGYNFDFEGDFGLVPTNCTVAYAMRSVNLWLFRPANNTEWGLSVWKASQSVMSWQNPS